MLMYNLPVLIYRSEPGRGVRASKLHIYFMNIFQKLYAHSFTDAAVKLAKSIMFFTLKFYAYFIIICSWSVHARSEQAEKAMFIAKMILNLAKRFIIRCYEQIVYKTCINLT